MKHNLIVMLTKNDLTVENALEIFEQCRDLPIEYWGFKNVGIELPEMRDLMAAMRASGKKTFLEVVTYTENSCLDAARFACECEFDYLLGTLYFPKVWEFLREQSIEYHPFVGEVSGSPSILTGNIESMISEAENLYNQNIPGIDILAYRYLDGNPVHLAREMNTRTKQKVVIAGGIDSIERIKTVCSVNPWAFTIGSALFNGNFVNGAGFRPNLERVLEVIERVHFAA